MVFGKRKTKPTISKKKSNSSSPPVIRRTTFSFKNRAARFFISKASVYRADLTKPEDLVHVLQLFLEYAPPAIAEWEKAIGEFRDRIPQIGASLKALIEKERQTNKKFIAAFEDFCSLCRDEILAAISKLAGNLFCVRNAVKS